MKLDDVSFDRPIGIDAHVLVRNEEQEGRRCKCETGSIGPELARALLDQDDREIVGAVRIVCLAAHSQMRQPDRWIAATRIVQLVGSLTPGHEVEVERGFVNDAGATTRQDRRTGNRRRAGQSRQPSRSVSMRLDSRNRGKRRDRGGHALPCRCSTCRPHGASTAGRPHRKFSSVNWYDDAVIRSVAS